MTNLIVETLARQAELDLELAGELIARVRVLEADARHLIERIERLNVTPTGEVG